MERVLCSLVLCLCSVNELLFAFCIYSLHVLTLASESKSVLTVYWEIDLTHLKKMSYNRPDFGFMDYERSVRSCFVGNIPYEASEDELKDIFAEVGTVMNFRLVYDRDSGKPKGYGFAEFIDQETALSAMRNLNGRELHGRTLRVDHATNEKARPPGFNGGGADEVMATATKPPAPENPYGDTVSPQDAPEAISKAVASLPPEQMFELMKQMKQCIQNNPVEARNMLLQNPQLAYALLQAQVVMKIVDPEIAMKMLHRQSPVPPPIQNEPEPERMDTRPNGDPFNQPEHPHARRGESPADRMDPRMSQGDRPGPMMHDRGPPPNMGPPGGMDRNRPPPEMGRGPPDMGRGPPEMARGPPDMGRGPPDMGRGRPQDMQRGQHSNISGGPGQNMGGARPNMGVPQRPNVGGPRMGGVPMDRGPPPGINRPMVPEDRPPMMNRSPMDRGPPQQQSPADRLSQEKDSRDKPPIIDPRRNNPRPVAPSVPLNMGAAAGGGSETQDQEKAALIMQVLQLTPDQIALLPEEQRKSILILKEQIQGGGA